jgi:hypothetical protein
LPVYLGHSGFDTIYPYGNGPWWWLSDFHLGTPPGPLEVVTSSAVCVDETHPGPPYREGAGLSIRKYNTNWYETHNSGFWVGWKYAYEGCHSFGSIAPNIFHEFGFNDLDDFNSSTSDMDYASQLGAKGWNKFRPTRSGADLGVFLGEIHEVPRMLKTSAKGFADLWRSMGGHRSNFAPKKLANHWLNHQFGWLPFLADLRDLYKTTKSLDSKLKQLRRDNGRWIRRRGTIGMESESEVLTEQDTSCGLYPIASSYLYSYPYGSSRVTKNFSRHSWFSGAFRYWIPAKPDSWYWNARAIAMLYGVMPSPSLVWELTPWSWLIDWCADVGDAINNMDSIMFDNLCAKYAYVMCHTIRNITYSGQNNFLTGPISATASMNLESKSRVGASPFGFGLTGGDFSSRQWSILGALGLSRLKH